MKMKSKLIVTTVLCLGIAGVASYVLLSPKSDQGARLAVISDSLFGWRFPVAKFPLTGSKGGPLAYSEVRDPKATSQGLPLRLKIPAIGVDSTIEDALVTPDGRMDVPEGSLNVAWFALGPHPGREGSAVIGGHFGIRGGVPFVFYKLDRLVVGDKVYVEDDKGDTIAFVVRSTELFDRNADATTVFTSSDGMAHLNLITCDGVWNKVNNSYPQRLVVFTDAVPMGTASLSPAPVAKMATSTSAGVSSSTTTGEAFALPVSVLAALSRFWHQFLLLY
ncbi:MAG: class F sortase [Candidatus Paceibacterota bacterium]